MRKIFAAVVFLLAFPAHALDSVSVELGRGGDDVNLLRAGAQWQWKNGWGYWEASAGAWTSDRNTVYDLGMTPVFRIGRAWYAEAAIGVHFLSSNAIEARRDFATHFQFGDHIGVGYRARTYDIGLRLQHLSNGGIENPNPGINFLILRVARQLD